MYAHPARYQFKDVLCYLKERNSAIFRLSSKSDGKSDPDMTLQRRLAVQYNVSCNSVYSRSPSNETLVSAETNDVEDATT